MKLSEWKRLVSFITAMVCCVMFAVHAGFAVFADDDPSNDWDSESIIIVPSQITIVASGTSGDLTWKLDSEGTLKISGIGEMVAVWDNYKGMIKEVIIEEGATTIAHSAFEDCIALSTITLPNSIISVGVEAFAGCTSLTDVSIPDSTTRIGNNAFENCTSLTSVAIGTGVSSIDSNIFLNCTLLEEIQVEESNMYYKDIDGVLFAKDGTELLIYPIGRQGEYMIPNGVVSVAGSSFISCKGLTGIEFSDTVTNIGMLAFSGCESLNSILLPDNVKTIGVYAFYECASLSEITIKNPQCDIYDNQVTISESATFHGYKDSTAQVYAEKYGRKFIAFDENETAITTTITTTVNTTTTSAPTTTTIDTTPKYQGFYYKKIENGIEITRFDETITGNVIIPEEIGGLPVIRIGEYASFQNEENTSDSTSSNDGLLKIYGWDYTLVQKDVITSVSIPGSVTVIGESAFWGCKNLKQINFSSGLEKIEICAFMETGITELKLPDSVKYIGASAFHDCQDLSKVTLPKNLEYLGMYNFMHSKLESNISNGNFIVDGWYIAYIAQNTTYPKILSIPEGTIGIAEQSYTYIAEKQNDTTKIIIPSSLETISDNAFRDYTGLEAFEVAVNNPYFSAENGVLYNKEQTRIIRFPIASPIVDYSFPNTITSTSPWAFCYCQNLNSVTMNNELSELGGAAFVGCNKLKYVTFSKNISKLYSSVYSYIIGAKGSSDYEGTFQDCDSLEEITIPENIDYIGGSSFAYCKNLKKVIVKNPSCEIVNNYEFETTFTNGYDDNHNEIDIIKLYGYKNSTVQAYAEKYGKSFVEIEEVLTTTTTTRATATTSTATTTTTKPAVTIVDSGECGAEGNNLTWTIDREGTLTISGKGAMKNWDVYVPWYSYGNNILNVTIENGVTSIGSYAFKDCDSLTSITIPEGVTSIGRGAFYDCDSLTSITIPEGVTSIGEDAFYGCNTLTSITIPNSVTRIGNAFNWCNSLISINVDSENEYYASEDGVLFNKDKFIFNDKSILIQYPAGKTAEEYVIPDSVKSISNYAFFNCDALTSIVIPNSVTSIGYSAFSDCSNLTTITIPDSVTSIGYSAFSDCDALTYITIPNSVTSIGRCAFHRCNSLISIYVDFENKYYASEDGVLFNKDKNILIKYPAGKTEEEYVIPDSVTSIGDFAFYYCDALTSIVIPDSVTSIDSDAFSNCDTLTSITIENSECEIFDSEFTISDTATIYAYKGSTAQKYAEKYDRKFVAIDEDENTTTTSTTTTSTTTSTTTTITSTTTSTTTTTTYIVNINKVDIIGTQVVGARLELSGIDENGNTITFEKGSLTVDRYGELINGVGETLVWISGEDTAVVIVENGTYTLHEEFAPEGYEVANDIIFEVSDGIVTVDGKVVDSVIMIDERVTTATTTTAPPTTTSTTTTIITTTTKKPVATIVDSGECGAEGDNLTWTLDSTGLLTISGEGEMASWGNGCSPWYKNNIIKKIVIANGVTKIGQFAFEECSLLSEVIIADSVTQIDPHAFRFCKSLSSIKLSNGITCIEAYTFSGCESLYSIIIPDNIVNIESYAFYYCSSLTSIDIPDSVISIGDGVFSCCNSLNSVTIPDSVINIGSYAFAYCDNLTTITIENPECEIYDSADTISDTATIYGYRGSTAQSYAEKYNRSFIAIDEMPVTTTTTTTTITATSTTTTITSTTTIANETTSETVRTSATRNPAFVEGYDNWGFLNRADYFTEISTKIYYMEEEHRKSLIEIVGRDNDNIEADLIKNEIYEERYNGSCFGLSLLAMYNCYGIIQPSVLDGKSEYLHNVVLSDSVKSLINYHSLLQRTTSIRNSIERYFTKNAENKKLQDLLDSLEDGNPTLLCYHIPDEQFSHAVIAYGIENGSYTFDDMPLEYDAKILIYDCGIIGFNDSYCMYVNTTRNEWYIPERKITEDNCIILWVQDDINELTRYSIFTNDIPKKEDTILPSLETIDMDNCSVKAVKKTSNNDEWFISSSDDEIYSYYGFMSGNGSSPLRYIMGDVNGNYLLKSEDNTLPAKLQMRYRDCLMRINSTTTDNIVFQPNGFEFTGVLSEYNIHMVLNDTPAQNSFHTIDVSGDSANKMTFKYQNGEWYMSGDMKNVVIQANNNDFTSNMLSFSIPSIYNKVCLRQIDERTIEAFVDIDNDGVYETPVDKIYEFTMGDVNEDGSVDSSDASLVLAEYAKKQTGGVGEFTDIQLKAADVNNDGVVDSSDASKILAYYAMISTGKEPTWD